jgi:hypothetical protein
MNVNINNCPNNNNISTSLLAQISKNKQIKNKIDQNVENVIDCVVSKVQTPKKIKLTNNENTNDVLADVADTFFGVNENIIYDENNIESDCLLLLSSINQSQIFHDQNFVDNSLASFIPTNGCLYYIKEIDKSVDIINTCPIDCLLFNFFILNKKIAEIQNYFRLYNNFKSIKVLNSSFDLISANNWAKCQYEWSRYINLISDDTFVNCSDGDCIEVNVWGTQMERFVEFFSDLQRGSYLTRCENKHCPSKIKYSSIKSFVIDSTSNNYPIDTKRIKCRACNHYRKFDRFNFLVEPVFIMVEASSSDEIVDFNNLKKILIINGESFQLMATTNFTSSKLSSNKNDHFTGIVKLNDDFVCFDNLNRNKEFLSINNLNNNQYSHFANNIGVSIYVRSGSSLNFDIPQIKPFDRNLDTPLNFLLLEKLSNVQLNEYLTHFDKFLNGILDKELFSWRFKVYSTNKLKEKKNYLAGHILRPYLRLK